MADLPKTIRVGYRDYAVEDWSPADASAAGAWGDCNKVCAVIHIREDLNAQTKAEILIHEVLHAAYWAGQIQDDDREERVVSVLGVVMAQVWRDNPDFVAFVSESLA